MNGPLVVIYDIYIQIDARLGVEYFYVPSHTKFLGWKLPYRIRAKLRSGL